MYTLPHKHVAVYLALHFFGGHLALVVKALHTSIKLLYVKP